MYAELKENENNHTKSSRIQLKQYSEKIKKAISLSYKRR